MGAVEVVLFGIKPKVRVLKKKIFQPRVDWTPWTGDFVSKQANISFLKLNPKSVSKSLCCHTPPIICRFCMELLQQSGARGVPTWGLLVLTHDIGCVEDKKHAGENTSQTGKWTSDVRPNRYIMTGHRVEGSLQQ